MIGLEYILTLYNIQHVDLADEFGIKKQNINLWIKGKQNIPKKYLPTLASKFDIESEVFQKELSEIDKLEIQKEKLKKELNPIIYREDKILSDEADKLSIKEVYDKEEINSIERTIEKTKIIKKFKDNLELVDNHPYIQSFRLIVELFDKAIDEVILHKTLEGLAHYLEVLPDDISSGEQQQEYESELFEVFEDNNF
jgi:plasmid maintenance system antidote protein VapI